ncbi:MAG: hypothetical protein ACTSVY_10345 [Candidatus Helarchaeota archaeon]
MDAIKSYLMKLGIKEIIEKTEKNTIEVPFMVDFDSAESIELKNKITITEDGWILIKCLIIFHEMLPDNLDIHRDLWCKLLQANYTFPELTFSLDESFNVFVETDMPVDTTFENFKSEYGSLKIGVLTFFNEIIPEIDAEINKVSTFERIHHLYLFMSSSGVLIYDKPFKFNNDVEPNLVSGSLSVFASLIQEITQTETNIKIVEQEGMTILLEHGKCVSGAILTEQNFPSLRIKLKELIAGVENQYQDTLSKFDGDTACFSSIDTYFEKIFGMKIN